MLSRVCCNSGLASTASGILACVNLQHPNTSEPEGPRPSDSDEYWFSKPGLMPPAVETANTHRQAAGSAPRPVFFNLLQVTAFKCAPTGSRHPRIAGCPPPDRALPAPGPPFREGWETALTPRLPPSPPLPFPPLTEADPRQPRRRLPCRGRPPAGRPPAGAGHGRPRPLGGALDRPLLEVQRPHEAAAALARSRRAGRLPFPRGLGVGPPQAARAPAAGGVPP